MIGNRRRGTDELDGDWILIAPGERVTGIGFGRNREEYFTHRCSSKVGAYPSSTASIAAGTWPDPNSALAYEQGVMPRMEPPSSRATHSRPANPALKTSAGTGE
jgi:hypothetical protein